MGNNPSQFKGADLPVDNVSWYDAVEFCELLSERTGNLYRLPTEVEWEYACRAGTVTPFHFGGAITPQIANYDGEHPYGLAAKGIYRERTTPVGSFKFANAFGLYDMHGNVWEWCQDWYHDNYKGAPKDGRAWEKPVGKDRVLRGGSCLSDATLCRATARTGFLPTEQYRGFGFRVVVSTRTLR
jgi:formylglycine-generating enzyme required for sulfatase activity